MSDDDKDKKNIEERIKEKELKKVDAEIARIEEERKKFEIESKELVRKFNLPLYKKPWFIQAFFGGLVAGALIAGFMLDHFLKVTELIKKEQVALKKDAEENRQQKKLFETEMIIKEKEYIGKLETLKIDYDKVNSINKELVEKYEELNKENDKYADEINNLVAQKAEIDSKRSAVSESIKQEVRFAKVRQSGEYLTNDIAERLLINKDSKPQTYTVNDFEEKTINGNNVVIDKATGLTWDQSGSKEYMDYHKAKIYVGQLNRDKYAGYNDWRLPTLKEALTLLEQEESSNGFFIDSRFDKTQALIWTSDKRSAWRAWAVYFDVGYCSYYSTGYDGIYVRAVR
ncbi:MAG: Lcl C-terminal domain-containing protein [Planctomycetota bacterium]|jgi:serine/threonine-protein kinase